jgi:Fe-S cluster assembly protein SufD
MADAGDARQQQALGRRGMNVAVMKTKAEQAISEGLEAVADALPGGTGVRGVRNAALGRFGALGLPHRRIEEWKYTDLKNALKEVARPAVGDATPVTIADVIVALGPFARLELPRLVLVNGGYRKDLSNLDGVDGYEVKPLAAALAEAPDTIGEGLAEVAGQDGDAVIALNTAFMTDGALVRLKSGVVAERPLLVVHVRAGKEPCSAAIRNIVHVGDRAHARLIELFVSVPGSTPDGQVNALTEIILDAGATLDHVKCASDTGRSTHLASLVLDMAAEAVYRGFQMTESVGLARNQGFVTFKGEGGKLDLSGVFLGRGSEHVDTTFEIDHVAGACESRELFKGVLDGEARGVFQGKVIVRPDAQKTDGKQMAQALMLSEAAEFDSKPELEIYADDVVCGHGTTSAELDEDLLFYFRSRGIPKDEARALMIESFVGEAIAKVEDEAVREVLMSIARDWVAPGRG